MNVTAVPYNPSKNKFLLLRRSKNRDKDHGKWEFPSIQAGGQKLEENAVRGLEETTGFLGEPIRTGERFEREDEGEAVETSPVLLVVKGSTPRLEDQYQSWKWVAAEEIPDLETASHIQQSLKKLGVSPLDYD